MAEDVVTITSTNSSQEASHYRKLIDNYTLDIIMIIQYSVISSLVNMFGVATNVVNIIVFIKQGFSESINISLFGLAISDMGSMIFLQWTNLCFSPSLLYSNVPFYPLEIQYLTAGWPRMTLIRITAWITAFITFERCLCITMPLKIKLIITPKRTAVIIVIIYIIAFSLYTPIYYTSRLVWKFFPETNRTLLGLGFTQDREGIDRVFFVLNNIILTVSAFVIVVICTIILVVGLNSKARWRMKSAAKSEHIASKDKKIVKMITVISAVFIICFFPNSVAFSAMAIVPDYNIDGIYRNIFIVTLSYCFILESISSSINIFLYYQMSTKFRDAFNLFFHCCHHRLPILSPRVLGKNG